jgi:3-oxoacyl-[acyl-carrier protein] reductase
MSQDEWDAIININLKGSFNCAQAAQKYMVKQNYGKIVNISSPVPATLVDRGLVNYSSAGAGVQGLTKALALELGRYNINVNCIAPDLIDTEMTRDSARRIGLYLEDLKKAATAQVALRRLGTVEDVANVALFLASDESSFISGQVIVVKGGP